MKPIVSAQVPPALVVRSRVELGAPARLPTVALDLSPFSVVEFRHGGAQLFDARGHGCGLFVNKQLAEQTAAAIGIVLNGANGTDRTEGTR